MSFLLGTLATKGETLNPMDGNALNAILTAIDGLGRRMESMEGQISTLRGNVPNLD